MSLTRTVVRTWLSTAKLPITLAESTLHRNGRRDEWPPVVAFDAFEAGFKQVVGSLVRDPELVKEGRLERERVTRLRAAADLESLAESRQEEADAEFRARREADEDRLRRIDEEAEARRQAEARRLQEEKERAEHKAARKAQTAKKAEVASTKAVEKADRAARSVRVSAEKEALAEERQAVAAKKAVKQIDRELQSTKSARRKAT
jgi:hypothetical protein